jgi:cell division protein FtsB
MASRPHKPASPRSSAPRPGRRPPSTPPTGRRPLRLSGATAAPQSSRSRAKLTGRAAIVALVIAVLAVSYASSMRAWLQQRNEIQSLSAEIVQRRAEVASLEQERDRWHDPAYIRAAARLRFGWVMPGETGYRVIDSNGDLLESGSRLTEPSTARRDNGGAWWETAWSSVVMAGRDPVDVAAAQARRAAQRPTPAYQIGGQRKSGAADSTRSVDTGGRLLPDGAGGVAPVDR